MRCMERTGASISLSALNRAVPLASCSAPCPCGLWSKDSSADATNAPGSPGSTARTVPPRLPLVPLVGDPRAGSVGLGCTWLLPKASEATYFRQQYKNTRAGPKGGKSAGFPEVSKADGFMSYVL